MTNILVDDIITTEEHGTKSADYNRKFHTFTERKLYLEETYTSKSLNKQLCSFENNLFKK